MTNNLKACNVNKHRLYKILLENPAFLPENKRYKNVQVNDAICTAKKNYCTDKFRSRMSNSNET